MKFDQLIENNGNIFVEKSYTKFTGEIILGPSSKKTKIERISGSKV